MKQFDWQCQFDNNGNAVRRQCQEAVTDFHSSKETSLMQTTGMGFEMRFPLT